jgi:zinc transporter ZupT
MESFARGWSFLQQAWSMAFKDRDLIKPSIYALIVGTIASVIGSIPMIVVAFFLGDAGRVGQFILAVMGAFLVFINFCHLLRVLRHDGLPDLRISDSRQRAHEHSLVHRPA